jgi:uncharacterized protein (TIGR03435 family)
LIETFLSPFPRVRPYMGKMMTDDMALLREYAQGNSEEAFAALVSRHVHLVYSVAMRQVRDPHLAEEITQVVFIILARKAKALPAKTILAGWLCRTAQYACADALKMQSRRQLREQEAFMQSTLNQSESEAWTQIAPLLDTALARLGETDHNAIVLRFLEGKSMKEVGAALGATEATAKKRVHRAVEKLQKFFLQRGVTSTTAILTGAISAHAVCAAPSVLAKTATAVALAKGATASTSTLTLSKGALKAMAWTKAKSTVLAGAIVLLTVGTATVTLKEIAAHRHVAWQDKFELSVLERVPPQVSILPSLPSTIQSVLHATGTRNQKALGLGQGIPDLLALAYGVGPARLILTVPVPAGRYDFIANLTTGIEANQEALRQEIKQRFGLSGRRERIETNVLVLAVQSRDAVGLKPTAGHPSGSQGDDYYSAQDQSISPLVDYLGRALGVVVIDQTGLSDSFDIDFKWDQTPEGLQRVLRDELGLKLTPARQSLEFVVVEKAN